LTGSAYFRKVNNILKLMPRLGGRPAGLPPTPPRGFPSRENYQFEALQKGPYTSAPFRRPRLAREPARVTDTNATRGRPTGIDVAFLLPPEVE
jgi:hypothetical protein